MPVLMVRQKGILGKVTTALTRLQIRLVQYPPTSAKKPIPRQAGMGFIVICMKLSADFPAKTGSSFQGFLIY
jgi:hypothetical protein